MRHITSFKELDALANIHDDIWTLLDDEDVSRARASAMLAEWGYKVSEKLIRTWRKKTVEPAHAETLRRLQELNKYNPFNPVQLPDPYGRTLNTSQVITVNTTNTESEKKAVSPILLSTRKANTIVIMPDVQAPLHDQELVDKFVKFLGDFDPTELGQVGDFTDSTEISRWVRGKKTEYAGDLAGGFRTAKSILRDIRNVFDGRFRIVRSNHDDRLELYIDGCAAGLASLMEDELNIEYLAGFDEYDVEFIRDEVVELTPGIDKPWIMAHGDEGSLNSIAGRTAFNLAKNKFGVNVVCGHTHRAGVTSESTGYNGKIRDTRYGLEVGHFMDLTKADYLKKKGVAANWQQAFGILEVYGERVYPRLITVQDGRFSVDGVEY